MAITFCCSISDNHEDDVATDAPAGDSDCASTCDSGTPSLCMEPLVNTTPAVPESLELKNSASHGSTVWTRERIPTGTMFGPFLGNLCQVLSEEGVAWEVSTYFLIPNVPSCETFIHKMCYYSICVFRDKSFLLRVIRR